MILTDAVGNQSGHTVQQFQPHRLASRISHRQHPRQCRRPLSRNAKVQGGNRQIASVPGNLQLAHANVHPAVFRQQLVADTVDFAESSETGVFHGLVSGMGGLELHNGVILVLRAEAADRLPPVIVIAPDRDAQRPRNARQEAGKGRLFLIIFHHKAAAFIKHGAFLPMRR